MFSSVKRFFAPSFMFSWAETKELISQSVALSRRSFWLYFRMFWWMWLVCIGVGIFYVKLAWNGAAIAEPGDMVIRWVENYGVLGAASLVLFLVVATFAYLSQFLIVRSKEGESLGFAQLKQQMSSHYQFVLLHPLLFLMYWAVGLIGDFYVFMFLESEGSWKSFRQSLWRGAKLGLRLLPLRFLILLLMVVCVMVPLFVIIMLGLGVWFLAKTSVAVAWCSGILLAILSVMGILWAAPRMLFFSLAMQSILYEKTKVRFPEVVE